jgi:transcriptional regulator with XRE-family HTH domain
MGYQANRAGDRINGMTQTPNVTELELCFIEGVEHGGRRGELTYAQIGAYLGVSQSQISQRQNGKAKYSLRDMHRIGQLLGVDPLVMAAGLGSWLQDIKPAEVRKRLDDEVRRRAALDSEPTVSCVERHVTRQHAIAI